MDATASLEALAREVAENGGVLSVTMERLRNACGYERVGPHVVDRMAEKLRLKGINHLPRMLPMDRTRLVRLYDSKTPAGALIKAVVRPGLSNDEKIVSLASSNAAETLRKISELLDGSGTLP